MITRTVRTIRATQSRGTTSASRTMLLVSVLAASGGLVACGDDDDSGSPTTTAAAVSVDDYTAEVNAICTAGNERIEALASESFASGTQPTEAQLIDVLDRLLDEISGQLDDIGTLDAPADLAVGVDAWLADARATSDAVRSSGASFFEQQASGVNPFATVNATALELGFDACGS